MLQFVKGLWKARTQKAFYTQSWLLSSQMLHCFQMQYLEKWCNPVAGLDSNTVILYKLIHCKTRKHLKGAAISQSLQRSSDIY